MTCVLLSNGQLHIYNATAPEDVLSRTESFTEVDVSSTSQEEWPIILPNQWLRFPGNVY